MVLLDMTPVTLIIAQLSLNRRLNITVVFKGNYNRNICHGKVGKYLKTEKLAAVGCYTCISVYLQTH